MPAPPITRFAGRYAFLSNFYHVAVEYDGVRYKTVEHGFQAAKTLDLGWRRKIQRARTAGDAKRFGRMAPLRPDWEQVKDAVMRELLVHKFSYPVFRQLLLDTGDAALIEGNTWGDRYWGQCPVGVGENRLGEILMAIREELRG